MSLCLKRTGIALASGWLALALARFPLILDNVYDTRFVWQLFFPMLIAAAWEPIYAYIAGLGGMVFLIPFLETPSRGWGNLLIGLMYLFLVLLGGHLCGRHAKRYRYYLAHVAFGAFYYVVLVELYAVFLQHNPSREYERFISPVILRVQAIAVIFSMLALAAFIKVLLALPPVRAVLHLAPLPYAKNNSSLFLLTLAVVGAFFLLDGLFESFYFASRGIHTSILSASFGRVVKLPMVFAAACMICDAIICSAMKNLESHDKLMKSEERYRMIFQHMADAYLEIDESGCVQKGNPAVQSNMGLSVQAVAARHVQELFGEPEEIALLMEQLLEEGQVHNLELKGLPDEQGERSLLVSGNILQLDTQRLTVLTVRNISNYKKAEEKRWELSALLNAIFDSNKDFIWTVDCCNFALLSFNQAFCSYIEQCFGRRLHFGSSPEEVFGEREAALFRGYYQQVLTKGDFSAAYIAPIGEPVLDLNFYPVKLHDDVASIAVFTKNVTAQKQAERRIVELNEGLEQTVADRTRELRTAYRDLESFSYTVTHEFKTPIREIDAYLEIIYEDNLYSLTEQSRQDMLAAKKVCTQTLEMIEKMMFYTKAGFMVLNIERIDMKQLVRACFQEIRQANEAREIELVLYDLPPLYADAFLLRTAIMNVLSNSIKFCDMHKKTVLVVGHMHTGDQLCYYFKDNGVGFASNFGGHLFELFNRAHNNGEYEGSGIGLALVKRILTRNGGQTEILGSPGHGCVVFFTFRTEKGN